jgi:hypothetical protein
MFLIFNRWNVGSSSRTWTQPRPLIQPASPSLRGTLPTTQSPPSAQSSLRTPASSSTASRVFAIRILPSRPRVPSNCSNSSRIPSTYCHSRVPSSCYCSRVPSSSYSSRVRICSAASNPTRSLQRRSELRLPESTTGNVYRPDATRSFISELPAADASAFGPQLRFVGQLHRHHSAALRPSGSLGGSKHT